MEEELGEDEQEDESGKPLWPQAQLRVTTYICAKPSELAKPLDIHHMVIILKV